MAENNKFMNDLAKCISEDLKEQIIDLLISCYGEKEIEGQTGFKISELKQGSDKAFSKLLLSYSGKEELRSLIWKGYAEFGYALRGLGISAPAQKDLMDGWDDKSKAILWHLYQRRHANIVELSEAVCASHYDVLSRLEDVIIPESRKILGEPIVKFEQSRMDIISGEKICFSWWIEDESPVSNNNVELFHERERILIVAGLPDMKLPDQIDVSARFKNGILEVAIKK
ncbi:MAG: hypothetical protein ACE14P_02165 [Methanotrichaceae archaeon]